MKTHYTIPFFITHKGCTHKCVFCDQGSITGAKPVKPSEVTEKITRYLETIPEGAQVEVGFFGGSFTGVERSYQKDLLDPVRPFLDSHRVKGIRLSTRPDMIDKGILDFLKGRGVTCIELGVQSMSEKVLKLSKRGHAAEDVVKASKLIVEEGLELGHQIMLGLPGSTLDDEMETARMAKELGATQVRIYPVIVLDGTELAKLWSLKKYKPLTEEEAAKRAALLLRYFRSNHISVIRCGLHPSEELMEGRKVLAGPFHPAFRQKAESLMFEWMLQRLFENRPSDILKVTFNPDDEGAVYGFLGSNAEIIKKISGKKASLFQKDPKVPRGCLFVDRG